MIRAAISLLVLLVLLTAGCSTTTTPVDNALATPPRAYAPWSANGKMALVSQGRAESVSFQWTRSADGHERVQLAGLLGFGAIAIERSDNRVWWNDNTTQRPLAALPLDADVQQILAALPYAELGDWLIGASTPQDKEWELDVSDWQVQAGWRVPKRLRLARGELGLRVSIRSWQPL